MAGGSRAVDGFTGGGRPSGGSGSGSVGSGPSTDGTADASSGGSRSGTADGGGGGATKPQESVRPTVVVDVVPETAAPNIHISAPGQPLGGRADYDSVGVAPPAAFVVYWEGMVR